MATPKEILERNKRIDAVNAVRRANKAKPISYSSDDTVLSAAENWDYTANKPKAPIAPAVEAPQAPQVEQPISDKPADVDDYTYNTLLEQGIPKERIAELYTPNKKDAFTSIFKESQPEPTPIDERTMRAKKNLAYLGEGVKVLGDMFGVSQGARVKERNVGELINKQEAQEQSERDKYLARLDMFNQGKRGAMEKDLMLELQDKSKRLEDIRATVAAKKKGEAAAAAAAEDLRRWQAEFDLKSRGQKADVSHMKNQDAIGFMKAKDDIKSKKAERDPNTVLVNIDGKPFWIKKTYISDIVGRARAEAPMTTTMDGKQINKYTGVKDEVVLNEVKDKYIRISKDGKTAHIARKAGVFPKENEASNESSTGGAY